MYGSIYEYVRISKYSVCAPPDTQKTRSDTYWSEPCHYFLAATGHASVAAVGQSHARKANLTRVATQI